MKKVFTETIFRLKKPSKVVKAKHENESWKWNFCKKTSKLSLQWVYFKRTLTRFIEDLAIVTITKIW